MAGLLDRIRNVYDDHQDQERQLARREGYHSAMLETRDALLTAAIVTHQQWRQDLLTAGADQQAIHAKYTARIQVLNDAFAVLRQADSGITTQLDVEQLRPSVTERVSPQRQEQSLADARTERGHEYGHSY